MLRSDFIMVTCAILICLIGLFCLYSSTYQFKPESSNFLQVLKINLNSAFGRQIVRLLISVLCFLLVSHFSYRKFWDLSYLFYGLIVFLLILVLFLGKISLGAQRWLKVWWINFQPSEFTKIIIILFLARYFSSKSIYDFSYPAKSFGFIKAILLPLGLVLIPTLFIIKQPDLGTAIIIFLLFVIMTYIAGVKIKYILIFLSIVILLSPFFWQSLEQYQKQRLLVFINPNMDPLGAGYTIIQSKIAIGSGQIFGKGWLGGTQTQLRFLPEAHTDFIFAIWAEEQGFFGSLVLLGLYFILIFQMLKISKNAKDPFAKFICLGITYLFVLQISINILMTMGFCPVVGLPLPLMSYGGSSLLVSFISLAILANIKQMQSKF